MATSFSTARAASTFPYYSGMGGGTVNAAYGSVTFDSDVTLAAALTVTACHLPAGAIVIGGHVTGADIDTGTEAFDFDLGWVTGTAPTCHAGTTLGATDADGFGNLGVMTGDAIAELKPVASIYAPLQGVLFVEGPLTFPAETDVTITVNADANAGGVGTMSVVVFYLVP